MSAQNMSRANLIGDLKRLRELLFLAYRHVPDNAVNIEMALSGPLHEARLRTRIEHALNRVGYLAESKPLQRKARK